MKIQKLSNTQKIVGFSGLALAAAACLLSVVQSSDKAPATAAIENMENLHRPAVLITVPAPELPGPKTLAAHKVVQNIVAPPTVAAAQMPTAKEPWQMGDVKAPTPKIPLSEKISAYTIVQLEQHPEHLPAIGEQMQLPMLNGQKVVANVQSSTTNPNGDYTWSGHLEGYGDDYPVVMTYGEHSIFATITTPEGSYTMESIDGTGWLYKNPAEVELSAPGARDFLDVPQ